MSTPGPPPGGDPNYPPQQPPPGPPQGQPGGAYPAPTQGYPQQHQQHYPEGGTSRGDQAADFARRHIRTPETKEFFKTSEFGVWLLTAIGIAIAGLSADDIEPSLVWILITILSFAYIISRGIAKSGTKHHDHGRDH